MRVKLTARMAGPGGVFQPGSIVSIPDEQAQSLIAGRQATALESTEYRTTAVNPVEQKAVSTKAKKKV